MYKLCLIVIVLGVLTGHISLCNLNINNTKLPENNLNMSVLSCAFEVFGNVQGVFFRKFTEKQAKSLGVKGWCMNTAHGTVKGEIEAPQKELHEMKQWLQKIGSPNSRIDKAVFSEIKQLTKPTYSNFQIRKF